MKHNLTIDTVALDVIRQSLIEYLGARKCLGLADESDGVLQSRLWFYVNARYAAQDEAFKARKVEWLMPRIRSASQALRCIAQCDDTPVNQQL